MQMGEFYSDDSESSSDEKKKDSKENREPRWVKPPLVPRSLELLRDSKEVAPPPPTAPPPGLLEKVVVKEIVENNVEDDDDDDEDEDEEEKESSESQAEETEAAPAEDAPDEHQETSVQNSDTAEAVSAELEQPPEPEDRPDDTVLHIRGVPDRPVAETVPTQPEDDDDQPQSAAAVGGFGSSSTVTPPPPPPPGAGAPASPNQGLAYNWNIQPPPINGNMNAYNSAPQITTQQYERKVKSAESDAEKRGLRRGLIAGFITGYVVKAYLDGRKRERYEKATEKQLQQRDEQVSQLQHEHQQYAERMTSRVEDYKRRQEEMSRNQKAELEKVRAEVADNTEEEQIFDQEGNRITLRPGWRVERSAGGYSVVLDEHNRIVHDAIHYGEAFKRDQRREQLSDDLFATLGGGSSSGAPSDYTVRSQPQGSGQQQQAVRGDLPGQQPAADLKHRLPEPRNPLMTTLASPWLWTAVAILIIIYFIAALT